jgi:hypothetical protein
MTYIIRSTDFTFDLRIEGEQSDSQKLKILDILAYVDTKDISDQTLMFVVDNLHAIFDVYDSAVATHNLPKISFSETLLPVQSHIHYYQALYDITLQTASSHSIKIREVWPVLLDSFVDQAFDDGVISAEIYLIMKVHVALYLPTTHKADVVFRRFTLTQPVFRNDRFHHFRNILVSIYRSKKGPTSEPTEEEVCRFFSEARLSPADFSFLKVQIQTSEVAQESIKDTEKTNQVIFKIQNQSPVLRKPDSGPSTPLRPFHIPTTGRSLDDNIVLVLSGVLPKEDLKMLRRMDFVDWVKGKPLRMMEGDTEHHFIIVQRIRHKAVCRNRVFNGRC